MAAFYGTVQGMKGEASRLGSARSGIKATVSDWDQRVVTELYQKDGASYCTVRLQSVSGKGKDGVLFDGPLVSAEATR